MSQFWQGVGEAEEGFLKLFFFDDKSMNSLEVVFV
ncbi:uncharacterized protein METZ01_LOCUS81904 [marine metagenome]|uniref:Uncharacterized protein n=1 Tax=marine metagenome TaxID=408172 RepID=A0A381ULP9_9ZZZZ